MAFNSKNAVKRKASAEDKGLARERSEFQVGAPVPCIGATLLQHPAQFIMKFPKEAWKVDRLTNRISMHASHLPMIAQWSAHAPTFWGRIMQVN
jgi:hypothetical protein